MTEGLLADESGGTVGGNSRPRRSREHRRRRRRRLGRRAYIRSIQVLPSMATLGNAVCGFSAMYVAALGTSANVGADPVTVFFAHHAFLAAAYLILLAMVFDGLDGRLARFARHTTDFGGQLDSLADVVSFGAAPAFIAMLLFKHECPDVPVMLSRLVMAIAAVYFSCAAIRLARFNVSNEHGEQHHFSFLGLPSPGAAGAVVGLVLLHHEFATAGYRWTDVVSTALISVLPVVVLCSGLLMVSHIRYPHLVNRYVRGRRSIARVIVILCLVLSLIVNHRLVLGLGMPAYAAWGGGIWLWSRSRPRAKRG